LSSNKKTKKTWLDDFESRVRDLGELESEHDSKANEIREKAIQRGREQVPKMINASLSGAITKLKYDPYDIKPINHSIPAMDDFSLMFFYT
jgi:predicted Holliday junction resolvase-like endonuclease